jgi:hypothetical protein
MFIAITSAVFSRPEGPNVHGPGNIDCRVISHKISATLAATKKIKTMKPTPTPNFWNNLRTVPENNR